ncbi:MAG: ROK family protein [Prevotellaceae bacterium]|jgi:glucokinase|nr:ROK family protein [Prevotellaceae bacterium]
MDTKKVVAGVDVGGTHTKIGFADKDGNIFSERTLLTRDYKVFDEFIKALSATIEQMKNNIAGIELVGIGVGAPNGNYYKGTIAFAPNLPWEEHLQFVDKLKAFYPSIPIILTNDANAAAIGEMVYGGAKGMKDFLLVTLGTGLGSGFVANGKMIYGHDSFAGELGHVIVERNGRQCGCGRKGCLETYVSATGICRTVFELLANTTYPSAFRDKEFSKIESKDIAKAAEEGDKIAQEAFEITGRMLGEALADAVTITSPETIFLFGGLAKAGKLIMEPTKKAMEENMLNIWKNKIKLQFSELQDKDVAVLGAAALAWETI